MEGSWEYRTLKTVKIFVQNLLKKAMQWSIGVGQKLKFGDKMNISQEGIALIKKFEGCKLEA